MRDWRLLIFLFVLSFCVRVIFFSTHVPFAQDQVRDYQMVVAANQAGEWLAHGPTTSVGAFRLPSLYYSFFQVVAWMAPNNFFAMDWAIVLLGAFFPVLIFLIAHELGVRKSLAFLVALGAIFWPRLLIATYAWNPNPVPIFAALFVWSSLRALDKSTWANFFLAWLSILILINLHFQVFVLVPLAIALLIFGFREWRKLLISIFVVLLLGLILLLPYWRNEMQNGWQNTKSALAFITQKNEVYERVSKPVYVTIFFSNFAQRVWMNDLWQADWDDQYKVFTAPIVLGAIIYWLIIFIAGWQAFVKYRQREYRPAVFVVSYLILLFLLRFYKGDKPDYYLFVFLPFVVGILSLALERIATSKLWLASGVGLMLMSLSLLAVMKLPAKNDYQTYQQVYKLVSDLSNGNQIELLPVHQELVVPLQYVFGKNVDRESTSLRKSVAVFCYAWQQCQFYDPSVQGQMNNYQYDSISYQDFSREWADYDPASRKVLQFSGYQAVVFDTAAR